MDKFRVINFDECPTLKNEIISGQISKNSAFHAMLNQTNIGQNNNKYYLLQVLHHLDRDVYVTLFRWGRVGKVGGIKLTDCGKNLQKAIDVFCKKFNDKSVNDFYEICVYKSEEFLKRANKYELIEMDYGDENENAEDESEAGSDFSIDESASKEDYKKKAPVESKLSKELQSVINLICDFKKMETKVKELNFDTTRSPLGKITKEQIKKGYEILSEIEAELAKPGRGPSHSRLVSLTSNYYTKIPHVFGMKVPPTICDKGHLKQECDLLEVLSDIEVVTKIIKEKSGKSSSSKAPQKHILDEDYEKLNCNLDLLSSDSKEVNLIQKLLTHTHAPTHKPPYRWYKKIKLINAFKINSLVQNDTTFEPFLNQNRKLLWHGSRITNIAGILKTGLRIAPPEAPVTGYMFGKGVYFADSCSKSAHYCDIGEVNRSSSSNTQRFLLLADVAIGQPHTLKNASYEAPEIMQKHKKDSIFGMGQYSYKKVGESDFEGAKIPKISDDTKSDQCILEADQKCDSSLLYNEFIVYDTNRINLKYLCQVDFEGDEKEEESLW